jgi:hypothetical protein
MESPQNQIWGLVNECPFKPRQEKISPFKNAFFSALSEAFACHGVPPKRERRGGEILREGVTLNCSITFLLGLAKSMVSHGVPSKRGSRGEDV